MLGWGVGERERIWLAGRSPHQLSLGRLGRVMDWNPEPLSCCPAAPLYYMKEETQLGTESPKRNS